MAQPPYGTEEAPREGGQLQKSKTTVAAEQALCWPEPAAQPPDDRGVICRKQRLDYL
jgi:hypothetical protein